MTGIADPSDAMPGKPVLGLACVALDSYSHSALKKHVRPHDREGNRLASASAALNLLEPSHR
jgi:nicotinamide mononucleotide (NMN) deamidase PncC